MRVKLRQLRLEKNLTQEEMAKLCDITRAYYTNIENAKNLPSLKVAIKIKGVLEYYSDDLFIN